MARKASSASPSRRGRKGNGKGGSSIGLYIVISLCVLALVGLAVWLFSGDDGYKFQRSHLDTYVEKTAKSNLLENGASVYVDMSDGMNSAYATDGDKAILKSVIDKLAANEAINFYELSNERITPLKKSHTDLYEYMLDPKNYAKQKAPIQVSLNRIVENRQPALLMTDFEEYQGNTIKQAAYAKEAFIKWLSMGYNVTFYKWNFVERGKNKLMFLAVFDDNANRLNSMVEVAVKSTDPNIETYVLGSREFAYPTFSQYISLKQGGNYHNGNGKDIVTNVMENGGKEDYISYARPYATASGAQGQFAPLDTSVGVFAEYYPMGVTWNQAITNAKQMQEVGIRSENLYTHLFSKLFVDFTAQDGYSIESVEVRTFDMQQTMEKTSVAANDSLFAAADSLTDKPEINMILTAAMEDNEQAPTGWKEIVIDFDDKFDGTFIGGYPSTDLIRANVVIAKSTPEIAKAISFFSWDGNPSLANSVKQALQERSLSPEGRIIYTYYIKTVSD